ncbi:MAG TPA: hypothetical protein VJG90_02730 [Candidatus Nanoarchaeia archaeon]|nr:hypothetical protein [Candidatus Nanoarchaeia archaeon]
MLQDLVDEENLAEAARILNNEVPPLRHLTNLGVLEMIELRQLRKKKTEEDGPDLTVWYRSFRGRETRDDIAQILWVNSIHRYRNPDSHDYTIKKDKERHREVVIFELPKEYPDGLTERIQVVLTVYEYGCPDECVED